MHPLCRLGCVNFGGFRFFIIRQLPNGSLSPVYIQLFTSGNPPKLPDKIQTGYRIPSDWNYSIFTVNEKRVQCFTVKITWVLYNNFCLKVGTTVSQSFDNFLNEKWTNLNMLFVCLKNFVAFCVLKIYVFYFKGTVQRDFRPPVFYHSNRPGPLTNGLK